MNKHLLSRIPPHLLLVLTTLFWAGNLVLGRAVHEDIPPVGLAFWRWLVVLMLISPWYLPQLSRDWPVIKRSWKILVVLSFLGIFNFTCFTYVGLQYTMAVNAILSLSVIPVVIVALSRLLFKDAITLMQTAGIAVSLLGILIIVSRGDPLALLSLSFNRGDLWIMGAICSWSLYSVLLKKRPDDLNGFMFFGTTVLISVMALLPVYLVEHLFFREMPHTLLTGISISYLAAFPSILSYIFWNHAVSKVGPNTAGYFIHLIPVFGILLSVLLLGEAIHTFHLAGIACVFSGICLTTKRSM
ncbi:MAG TPA: DMT family transporter [Deltaproteobacteria bacterium]|nr:DMT family transporter [Deltaproteobacteria bacterium]HPJ92830.1 DMT family transporter [Deltaproteobacteria bacterium]HPR50348.1 DMT family transporter [Deltaproteobacteria bacterium]